MAPCGLQEVVAPVNLPTVMMELPGQHLRMELLFLVLLMLLYTQ